MDKCNICGKNFDMWDEQENFVFTHHVGYGSRYDGDKIQLKLCCDCFDDVFDMITPLCKINPIVEEDYV